MQKRLFFTILLAIFALTMSAEGLTYLSTEDFKKKVCYYDLKSGQQPQWKYIGDKPCLIDYLVRLVQEIASYIGANC